MVETAIVFACFAIVFSAVALICSCVAWGVSDANTVALVEAVRRLESAERSKSELGRGLANHKREIAKFIELANGSEQKRDLRIDALQAAVQELAAKQLPVHASHQLLTELERQIGDLQEAQKRNVRRFEFLMRDKCAGAAEWFGAMLSDEEVGKAIARDVLTYRPEALADAAHAACEVDTRRWRTETANDPAGDDGEDEQVTELGEPTFVEVDERAEA